MTLKDVAAELSEKEMHSLNFLVKRMLNRERIAESDTILAALRSIARGGRISEVGSLYSTVWMLAVVMIHNNNNNSGKEENAFDCVR